jgi:hypothetical protein
VDFIILGRCPQAADPNGANGLPEPIFGASSGTRG